MTDVLWFYIKVYYSDNTRRIKKGEKLMKLRSIFVGFGILFLALLGTIQPYSAQDLTCICAGCEDGTCSSTPATLSQWLSKLFNDGEAIKQVAFEQDGNDWVILRGKNGWAHSGVSTQLNNTLKDLTEANVTIKNVAFTPDDGWIVLYGRNGYRSRGLPNSLLETLANLRARGENLKYVSFTPNGGWVVFYGRNGNWRSGIPQGAREALSELNDRNVEIKNITFAPDGSWIILYNDRGYYWAGTSRRLRDRLEIYQDRNIDLKQIAYDRDGNWVILAGRNLSYTFGID